MTEAAYDSEIAPVLKALADRCKELGMPILAVVEYEPGSFGRTASCIAPENVDMLFIHQAAITRANLDLFVLTLGRIVRADKIPHNSIVLERMGIDPDPTKRIQP